MNYQVNQIWRLKDDFYRILYLDYPLNLVYWIEIYKDSSTPQRVDFDHLSELLDNSDIVLVDEPFVPKNPELLKEASKKKWDFHCEIIKNTSLKEPLIFEQAFFNESVSTICSQYSISRNSVKNIFRRYWQRGMTNFALIPDLINSGGKGIRKPLPKSGKRGRPNVYTQAGSNVDKEDIEKLVKGYLKYYLEIKDASIDVAYKNTLNFFFSKALYKPTKRQFSYWGKESFSVEERLKYKKGIKIFNKDKRIITDSSQKGTIGPGSIFQIDSTRADIELVSEIDKKTPIGSPTLYIVTDVFSRMITGFHISFENASYFSAMLALANAFENKKEFCERYKIYINEADWPSCHLPQEIVADRAELLRNQSSNIVEELNITIQNPAGYRADLKGLVEHHFQTVHQTLKGTQKNIGFKSLNHGDRGVRDARLDACLTLTGYIKIIINSIIDYNTTRFLSEYPIDSDMVRDKIKPIPSELWNWGLTYRSGKLRTINIKDIFPRLYPRIKSKLNKKGIRFNNGLFNLPPDIELRNLQLQNQNNSIEVNVSYHPWDLSRVFLHYNGKIYSCPLSTTRSPLFQGHNIWEIGMAQNQITQQRYDNETKSISSGIKLINSIKDELKESKQVQKAERVSQISSKKIRENRDKEKLINREKELNASNTKVSQPNETKVIKLNPEKFDFRTPDLLDEIEGLLNS